MEGEIPKKDEFRLISARSSAQIVQTEQLMGRDWLHELVAQSFLSFRKGEIRPIQTQIRQKLIIPSKLQL